jgi:hypothetical protein
MLVAIIRSNPATRFNRRATQERQNGGNPLLQQTAGLPNHIGEARNARRHPRNGQEFLLQFAKREIRVRVLVRAVAKMTPSPLKV